MKTPILPVTLVIAVLALATAASALELYTPPMFAGSDHRIECAIANVTTTPRTVRIQVVDGASGAILNDSGSFTLPGGGLDSQDTDPGPGIAYCHFTVMGVMANVRASGAVFPEAPLQTDTARVPAY